MPSENLTPQRITRLLALARTLPLREVSIDKPVMREDGARSTLAETMPDASAGVVEELVDSERKRIVAEAVARALDKLKPRERAITALRFGLDGGCPMTHDDIGVAVGLTAQRVGQIESSTLPALARLLADGLAALDAPPPPPPPERWQRPSGRLLVIEPKRAGA